MAWLNPRARAAVYAAILLALNFYLVQKLFSVEFTNNMQTNDGSFLAITRFVLAHFPHLNWFPWWFNGQPFENSYTPMLHLMDAAFAWVTGSSPARAYNFVTGLFYVIGPVVLFLAIWRLSGFLETAFFAALLYSLYSPAEIFPFFLTDAGWLNPWRLRVLVYWGEGPHVTALALLPFAIFAAYRVLTTRRYLWCVLAAVSMAWMVLVNAFAATDLAIACACLIVTLPRKLVASSALRLGGVALAGYLLACPFLPPSLIGTVSYDSQFVDGDFRHARLFPVQLLVLALVALAWVATWKMRDRFLRFSSLFASALVLIVGLAAVAGVPALPQPHRYSLEMEMALCILAAFAFRPFILRLPWWAKAALLALALVAAGRQTIHDRRYARVLTQAIDVTQTPDYQAAKWLGVNLGGLRAFVGGDPGLWLNAFVDTPQMNSGHQPFDENEPVDSEAVYVIYSDDNAGARAAEISLAWMKAFGCHAVLVAPSRIFGQVFKHPHKFDGILPVLWKQGDDVIYGIPQRTRSLAHVVPESAIVLRRPVNGLDVEEIERYVGALDDPSLPDSEMEWASPDRGRLRAIVHPGQVISIQTTYDPGWIALANGKPARVAPDGLGMSVIHPDCDGACSIDFVFDGGWERKLCRALSIATILAGLCRAGSRLRGCKADAFLAWTTTASGS
ncbi:MAG TPA: hypothetical protein VIY49_19770 [Bryobacteraceae bacterium]